MTDTDGHQGTQAQTYLAGVRVKDAASTLDEATRSVNRFETWRAGRDITLPLLLEWHTVLAGDGRMASTRNTVLAHVKMYLRWLVDTGVIPPVDVGKLRNFRVERKLPVVLSRTEIAGLVTACKSAKDQRTARAVLTMLFTGCRRHEALKLQPHDIKQDGLLIRSDKTGERMCPRWLLGPALDWLRPFPNRWERHAWAAIRKAAGLPKLKAKSLRSTAASYIIASGKVSPKNCAGLIGHSVQIAEKHYWSPAPIWNITGENIVDWYGLNTPPDAMSAPQDANHDHTDPAAEPVTP